MTAGGYFGRALVVDVTDGEAATLPLRDSVAATGLDAGTEVTVTLYA